MSVCRYAACAVAFVPCRRDQVYHTADCGRKDRQNQPAGIMMQRVVSPATAYHDAKLDAWADDDVTCCGHRVRFDTDTLGQLYAVCGVCGVHLVRRRVAT